MALDIKKLFVHWDRLDHSVMDWTFIIKEFGPVLGLVFFLLWREQKREEECRKTVREKDEFITTTLVNLTERVTAALNRKK